MSSNTIQSSVVSHCCWSTFLLLWIHRILNNDMSFATKLSIMIMMKPLKSSSTGPAVILLFLLCNCKNITIVLCSSWTGNLAPDPGVESNWIGQQRISESLEERKERVRVARVGFSMHFRPQRARRRRLRRPPNIAEQRSKTDKSRVVQQILDQIDRQRRRQRHEVVTQHSALFFLNDNYYCCWLGHIFCSMTSYNSSFGIEFFFKW
jgi:hypothetical protein